jgi:hypothetical protein
VAKKKKSKKKHKSAKYEAARDFISPDVAIIQASTLLDAAALRAIKSGNIKDMAIVSRGWLEVGGILAGIGAQQAQAEAETHELHADTEIGFRGMLEDGVPEEEQQDRATMGFRSNNG